MKYIQCVSQKGGSIYLFIISVFLKLIKNPSNLIKDLARMNLASNIIVYKFQQSKFKCDRVGRVNFSEILRKRSVK